MNLASKRVVMLSAVAGLLACIASAQLSSPWVKDTFEEPDVESGVGGYKAYQWGAGDGDWNYLWVAADGDASTIQEGGGDFVAARPIVDEGHTTTKALKLETEGQLLSRIVNYTGVNNEPSEQITPAPIEITATVEEAVWVDTLIKFTPSEDEPEGFPGETKLALWVNAASNLVVRHHIFDGDGIDIGPSNATFTNGLASAINPEQWYRLTISVGDKYNNGTAYPHFTVYLDGTVLEHPDAASEVAGGPAIGGGKIFFMNYNTTPGLHEVVFQGTGWVDDLVVAAERTPFEGGSSLMLTLVYDSSKVLNVKADNVAAASNSEIASGAALTFDTADWYRFDSVTGDGITYDNGTVTADAAGCTATINAKLATNDVSEALDGLGLDIDPGKLIAWALNNELSETAVMEGAEEMLDDYLLNVAPGTDAALEITSILVDGDDIIITVSATDETVDFTKLNGTLVVWSVDELGADWGEPSESAFTVNSDTLEAVITIDGIAGKFFKAVVR